MESKAIKIAYANAIVEKMWLKGIINDVEKEKITKPHRAEITSIR